MILLGLMWVATPLGAANSPENLDDADIKAAIESQILADEMAPFHSIDVTVTDGIATLAGSVDTIAEGRRAVMLSEAIKGVRSVVDRLEVTPVARSDDQIRRDVERALLMDAAADSYEIHVSVDDGVVTLQGTVESWPERDITVRVAEDVKGVKEVRSQIAVDFATERPDYEIAAEVEKRLQWDTRVDEGLIEVRAEDGVVKLSGFVGSAIERSRAAADAWVAGVEQVDTDDLRVEWWARDEAQRAKLVMKSDEEVERAVEDAFLYDPRVLSFNPDVEVSNGVVTLSGVVDNLEAKRAAERDAENTVGVVHVRNHLRVRPDLELTDDELEDRVEQALLLDPFVDRFDIGISVYNGRAYLSGTVDRSFDKWHAESVAAGVEGVVDVANNLMVLRTPVHRSDFQIELDIEDELRWSPFVDADEVNVDVTDGVATLTGTVDTWNERAWAAENAREGGADSVNNELKVELSEGTAWLPHYF
jgi:osmotically-inducible protein OsmY